MSSDEYDHALVIEANSFVLREIVCRLFSIGHRSAIASNQADAYELLRKNRVDYLLLDHCLPILKGYYPSPEAGLNFLKYIRTTLGIKASALPAILISKCRKDMESGFQFMKAGASECIPVPFEEARETLETKIERALKERNPQRVEAYKHRKLTVPSLQPPDLPQIPSASKPFLEIDVSQESVYCQGEFIPLQHMQFKLLLLLARSPGLVIRREEMFNALFGPAGLNEDHRPFDNQVDKIKSRLVKIFKPFWGNRAGQVIVTKTKVGFYLNLEKKDIKIIEKAQSIQQPIPTHKATIIKNTNFPQRFLCPEATSTCMELAYSRPSGCL